MSAPTGAKKTPAKKTQGKAQVKRSPRAARPPAEETTPTLSEAELAALRDDLGEEEPAEGEIRPVVIGKRGRRGEASVEMVTIFELDDVPYQVPRNPSAALVLSWMLDVQQSGMPTANQRMGVTLLGEAPLRALAAAPDVEPEDLWDIFENIGTVFFTSDNYNKIMGASDPS